VEEGGGSKQIPKQACQLISHPSALTDRHTHKHTHTHTHSQSLISSLQINLS